MRLSFRPALTLIGRLTFIFVLCLGAQVALSAATPASANDDLWTVVESSGQVSAAEGEAQWAAVRNGDVLPPGVEIATGTDGRLKLVRNGDTLDVAPDSQMQVDNRQATGDANIGVSLGTVLFKVETRPEYSFGVKTPYMAAVIKGTTFTVTVNLQGAALHVIEGRRAGQLARYQPCRPGPPGPDRDGAVGAWRRHAGDRGLGLV
jgi:ferric-dicitrate binding protein FerR (iron transport regulator)